MLLQGIFWLRSLIQIKLGLMAFFGVYAIGMMTLRNTSDCQPMSPMGQKRTFVFQIEPISDVDQTHTTAHQELAQHDGSSVARVKCIVQIDACENGEHISLQESH